MKSELNEKESSVDIQGMNIPSGEGRRWQCPLESKKRAGTIPEKQRTTLLLLEQFEQGEEPKEKRMDGQEWPDHGEVWVTVRTKLHPLCNGKPS